MNGHKMMTVCVGLCAALAATAAAAAPPIEVQGLRSIEVSYGDLNMTSGEGLATLDSRIRGAARQLCRPDHSGIMPERVERRACYRTAVADAQAQLALSQPAGTRLASRQSIVVAVH